MRERHVEGYRILYLIATRTGGGGVNAGDVLVTRVFGPGQDRSRI